MRQNFQSESKTAIFSNAASAGLKTSVVWNLRVMWKCSSLKGLTYDHMSKTAGFIFGSFSARFSFNTVLSGVTKQKHFQQMTRKLNKQMSKTVTASNRCRKSEPLQRKDTRRKSQLGLEQDECLSTCCPHSFSLPTVQIEAQHPVLDVISAWQQRRCGSLAVLSLVVGDTWSKKKKACKLEFSMHFCSRAI